MADPFTNHRDAALALLNGNRRFTRNAGSFLGQIVVDDTPLTEKQAGWLGRMLDRHGLPPLVRRAGP